MRGYVKPDVLPVPENLKQALEPSLICADSIKTIHHSVFTFKNDDICFKLVHCGHCKGMCEVCIGTCA